VEISESALLLRDFVNTLDVELAGDEIDTPARLRAWLTQRGLVSGPVAGSEADVRTARALREGLRSAMLAHHASTAPQPHGSGPVGLDEVLAGLPLRVAYAGGPGLVPCRAGVVGALGWIAAALVGARGDGSWARLKVCQEDGCRWAFLDTSKNRSRAWCSMRVCGNRTKTRAYRARRRG
jgi:predicted RNA-binding Zn ribbon-like protein